MEFWCCRVLNIDLCCDTFDRSKAILGDLTVPIQYILSGREVNSKGSSKPLLVDFTLNGLATKMEVNTRDSVSLMSEARFKPLQDKGATL